MTLNQHSLAKRILSYKSSSHSSDLRYATLLRQMRIERNREIQLVNLSQNNSREHIGCIDIIRGKHVCIAVSIHSQILPVAGINLRLNDEDTRVSAMCGVFARARESEVTVSSL